MGGEGDGEGVDDEDEETEPVDVADGQVDIRVIGVVAAGLWWCMADGGCCCSKRLQVSTCGGDIVWCGLTDFGKCRCVRRI